MSSTAAEYARPVSARDHVNAAQTGLKPRGASPVPLASRASAGLYRHLGETDLRVYPLALGASVFGWTADHHASRGILDRYFECGGNFIDTADSYAGGRSEVIIGSWLKDRANRDDLVLATKIGRHPDNPGLTPGNIIRAVEDSLTRLRTDHIDVLFFHEDDQSSPLEDSLAAADTLVESGKVRYLAASNYTVDRLIQARILSAYGLSKFAAVQTEYSLVQREFEGEMAVIAEGQRLAIVPYFALAHGFLSGKYLSRHQKPATERQSRAVKHVTRKGLRILAVLNRVAAELEVSAATAALAWLLAKPNITAPVTSASRPDQIDDLMAAATVQLTRGQVRELDRVSG